MLKVLKAFATLLSHLENRGSVLAAVEEAVGSIGCTSSLPEQSSSGSPKARVSPPLLPAPEVPAVSTGVSHDAPSAKSRAGKVDMQIQTQLFARRSSFGSPTDEKPPVISISLSECVPPAAQLRAAKVDTQSQTQLSCPQQSQVGGPATPVSPPTSSFGSYHLPSALSPQHLSRPRESLSPRSPPKSTFGNSSLPGAPPFALPGGESADVFLSPVNPATPCAPLFSPPGVSKLLAKSPTTSGPKLPISPPLLHRKASSFSAKQYVDPVDTVDACPMRDSTTQTNWGGEVHVSMFGKSPKSPMRRPSDPLIMRCADAELVEDTPQTKEAASGDSDGD